jgi:heterodisulfide reductase subunit B2
MKIGFYPGCSLKGSSREYSESLYALAEVVGIELQEIPDWNCCGATAAHNLNRELSLALPARILAAAEKMGMEEVLVPCAACYGRLSVPRHELLEDEPLRKRISEILGQEYTGSAKIINIVEFIQRIPEEKWQASINSPFTRKVACYYGCLLVRPAKVLKFDRPEDPQSLDNIMKKIGATPIDWAFKVECCGAGFSVSRTETVARLSGQILDDAVDRGAEAIIVACPMCHSNLDMRREKIETYQKKKYNIPIIYISQAIGMAMGISREKLGLQRHKVPVNIHLQKASTGAAPGPAQTEK